MSTAIYNMAHCYLNGGYTKNKRKGISYLHELENYLIANGKDIKDINDRYGIIKDYS